MANELVLVVDDDPTALALVSFILNRRGQYEVIVTCNPKHALKIVESNSAVGMVVSDVEMPALRGPELIREIKQAFPKVGCALVTASTNFAEELPPNVPILAKPVNETELLSAVRTILHGTNGGRCI